jgi:hypothetical protein
MKHLPAGLEKLTVTEEIPCNLFNPKVCYHVQKSLPLVLNQIQMNAVHTSTKFEDIPRPSLFSLQALKKWYAFLTSPMCTTFLHPLHPSCLEHPI